MPSRLFTGLSAFPITPVDESGVDEAAYARLVTRLAEAGVDSVGALGSTGSSAYLDRAQRAGAARIAVEAAGDVPVIVGIGALRTADVLRHAEDAQVAGAAAVLLAPVSYQPLHADEVYGLYAAVAAELDVPLCVYDNPNTTHFSFSEALYGAVAALDGVAAVKIPPAPVAEADARIAALRAVLPDDVVLGVSGDAFAASGLVAGAQAWFSVVGGLFPEPALAITRAVLDHGDAATAHAESDRLRPLWDLFARHGSVRVVATAAHRLGLTGTPNLPLPLRGLEGEAAIAELDAALAGLGLGRTA